MNYTNPFIIEPTYIPPSPPLLLWPTILIPRKLTVSIFNETVIIFKDIVLSVILLNDEVRDMGGNLCRRLLCGRRRSMKKRKGKLVLLKVLDFSVIQCNFTQGIIPVDCATHVSMSTRC